MLLNVSVRPLSWSALQVTPVHFQALPLLPAVNRVRAERVNTQGVVQEDRGERGAQARVNQARPIATCGCSKTVRRQRCQFKLG